MVKILALQPQTPPLNLGDVVAPEAYYLPASPPPTPFLTLPKPRPIIVIVVSPNLQGHLPALFWELGQLRKRLPPSPAVQNLGSFHSLLYSKSSRLPSSPCPGGDHRMVAAPSTPGSHNPRMSPPESEPLICLSRTSSLRSPTSTSTPSRGLGSTRGSPTATVTRPQISSPRLSREPKLWFPTPPNPRNLRLTLGP